MAATGENERRWGITRHVVRENAFDDATTLMLGLTALAGDGLAEDDHFWRDPLACSLV